MNQLSQLLYFGNVLGNLGPLLVFIGLTSAAGGAIFTTMHYCFRADVANNLRYCRDEASVLAALAKLPKRPVGGFLFFALTVISFIAAAFCPSQETVYAIAASQMGEQALKSPVVTKASQALESWLDKQIAVNKEKPQ